MKAHIMITLVLDGHYALVTLPEV